MRKRVVLAGFTLAVLRFPEQVCAQFTDPHTYDNTPVGVNRFELNYGHAHSNTSIDTALATSPANDHPGARKPCSPALH